MNAFYSILSINITPETGEKIAVGLLLSNGKESLFRHSGQKVKILSSLLPQDQISFINKYLKSINKVITEIGKKENELLAFEGLEINHFVNEYYLDYLSNYNQNVITFSKPNRIDVQVEKSVFEKLYKNLITSYLTEKEPQKKHNISLIRDRFIPTVTEYFSIDKELSPNDYDDLKFPVQIDLFGKNEKPVIAKFLDLERNISFVKSDYFDINQVIRVLTNCKSFLVSAEPEKKKYKVQHDVWERLKSDNKMELVDVSEVERIKEYAVEHGVCPF